MPGGSSKEQRSMCVCMYTNSLLLIQKVDIYQNIRSLLKHMMLGYDFFFYIGFKDLIELTEKYIVNEVLSIQKVDIYQNIRSLLIIYHRS